MADRRESTPRVRRAPIPDDAVLVVRGFGEAEPDASIRQASQFLRRFGDWGRFGLSGFYARSSDEVMDVARDRLSDFETLLLYRISDLVIAGFDVVPTFRSPHVTIAFYTDDLAARIASLFDVRHDAMTNPYFEPKQ